MTTIFLVRHGRSTANQKGLLAGRAANVELDATGLKQAAALGEFFSEVAIDKLISSPLERCVTTAREIKNQQPKSLKLQISQKFIECDYGAWTNKKLVHLAKKPLWKTIQTNPSLVTFPDGEAMNQMSLRAINGLLAAVKGVDNPKAKILIVTHADLIKALIANALGVHLDNFQKIVVDPASVSTLNFEKDNFFVAGVNEKYHLKNIQAKSKAPAGAVLGGGAG